MADYSDYRRLLEKLRINADDMMKDMLIRCDRICNFCAGYSECLRNGYKCQSSEKEHFIEV